VWHQFVIRVAGRDQLRRRLADAGIDTMVHYPVPPFAQPAYADLRDAADFPRARQLAQEVLSLPIGPMLADEDQAHVIEVLRSAVELRSPRETGWSSLPR